MKSHLLAQVIVVLLLVLGISSSALGKTVNLAWDASPSQVAGYRIYYGVNSSQLPLNGTGAGAGASPIDVGPNLNFTLSGLSDAASHYFAVTAYNSAGQESGYSNIVHSPPVPPPVVPVNQPPVFTPVGNRTVQEGAQLQFTVSATDPDGNALTYSASALPTGATFNASDRRFTWTPGLHQAGVYSVTFAVTDGKASVSTTISITVINVNQPPVLNPIGTKTVNEGEELSFTILATDADGDSLSYSATGLPAGASFSTSNRRFRWTPGYSGSKNIRVFSVTFRVSDGVAQTSELVTINVVPINRPPVLAPIGPQTVTAGENFNLIVYASDPDNDPLIYSADNRPSGAVFAPSTRSFSWIPGANQAGTHQVTFRASDGTLQASETVVFTVVRGNEPPVFNAIGAKTVNENELLAFTVAAVDPNGDNLVYSAGGLPPGAVFNSNQRRFSWTPNFDQAGSFVVTFHASDGSLSASEAVMITVSNSNRPPQISGQPDSSVTVGQGYFFAPAATDPDGDSISYSISGLPFWATFDQHTGVLRGTPVASDIGVSTNIRISVSDGTTSVPLSPFSIEVVPAGSDPDEGDSSGELDSDGDGIPDIRDGFPFDPTRTAWTIQAAAGPGGYINPAGETSVLFGGSQDFTIAPKAGYYINDLLVDGVSVGLVDNYEFSNIGSHHTIQAVFAGIPQGLSQNPLDSGLSGVVRVDGGDNSHNRVDDKPRLDLDYRFQVVLRAGGTVDQYKVFAVINGYRYEMSLEQGVLASGARYALTTRLGPAHSHRFHFVVVNPQGQSLWRYPSSGDLPGPVVELLSGRNLIGIVGNINPFALSSLEVVNDSRLYRWHSMTNGSGSYQSVDSGAPVAAGEGYVFKRNTAATLPDLSRYSEISDAVHEFEVVPGWNLIANPYGGAVLLEKVQVRAGEAVPVGWLAAATQHLVVDGIYSYLGDDWGAGNEFASAGGTNKAVLVPWIGYWIYVNPTTQPMSLLIPKPLH